MYPTTAIAANCMKTSRQFSSLHWLSLTDSYFDSQCFLQDSLWFLNHFHSLWLGQLHSLEFDHGIFHHERGKVYRLHCFWTKRNTILNAGFLQCRHEGSRKKINKPISSMYFTSTLHFKTICLRNLF